jgi:hypothetical protein
MSKNVKLRHPVSGKEYTVSEEDAQAILKNKDAGAGYIVVGDKVPEEIKRLEEKNQAAAAEKETASNRKK